MKLKMSVKEWEVVKHVVESIVDCDEMSSHIAIPTLTWMIVVWTPWLIPLRLPPAV
jgi:hypothetical protein